MAKKGKKEKSVKTEAQLLKEEEDRKKMMEELKMKAKEKQQQEEKISNLNSLKIQNKWRDIMKAGEFFFWMNLLRFFRLENLFLSFLIFFILCPPFHNNSY